MWDPLILVQGKRRGLAEALLEVGADGLDELGAVDSLGVNAFHQVHEVLGNDTGVEGVEASALELVTKVHELLDTVLLTALAQGAAPCKDGSHGVGGSLLALEILVVVAGYGTVGSLILVVAVGANEYAGHHSE